MGETKIDLYLRKEDIETFIFEDESYPNMSSIFRNYAHIFINLSAEDMDAFLEEMRPLVATALDDIAFIPEKDIIDNITSDYNNLLQKNPRSIFILDITREEALAISSKYGVIVQSSRNIDDSILDFHYYKYIEREQKFNKNTDGWCQLLSTLKLPPFNSLVITDQHLLTNMIEDKNVGVENIKLMLKAILPTKLGIPFHLMIITPMHNLSSKKVNKINGDLKAYLKTIRTYDFNIEFVFTDTLHPRKGIANYFVITCDKGFKLFHPIEQHSGYDDNDLHIVSILNNAKNICGDTILKVSARQLSKIKDLCQTLQTQIASGVIDHTKKIIGDTEKDKSIRNRLLN